MFLGLLFAGFPSRTTTQVSLSRSLQIQERKNFEFFHCPTTLSLCSKVAGSFHEQQHGLYHFHDSLLRKWELALFLEIFSGRLEL